MNSFTRLGKTLLLGSLVVCAAIVAPLMAQDQTMTPELLWKLGRLGEAAVSDDGQTAVYSVRRYKLAENSGASTVFLLNVAGQQSEPIVEDWPSINSIQWSTFEDQPVVYFIGVPPTEDEGGGEEPSDDDVSASPQVWRWDPSSTDLTMVTSQENGVANLKVSPGGKYLAFTIDVKLDETVNDLYADLPDADARIIDGLMFRHWNAWHDFKFSHLHVAPLDDGGMAGEAHDLMAEMKVDCPVPPFGGSEQFAWSPAGNEITYTAKIVGQWEASTDTDLYVQAISEDGSAGSDAVCITDGMDGYDNNPFYSPDGKYIGFNSMQRPGFEADRNRVMLYDRGQKSIEELTAGLDQNANHAMWTTDSAHVLFVSEYRGSNQIFRIALKDKNAEQLTEGPYNWELVSVADDNDALIVTRTSMLRPAELFRLTLDQSRENSLTQINDDIYSRLELPSIRERWVTASDGKQIHCWVIYPPHFDDSRKWPLLTYCQGGPQGQVGQWFSYRWNFHLMAANGYVVLAPNRRGLPGFGRQWNDQISGDWGGQAMQDLLSATDEMLDEDYIDGEKTAAIGASFGGFTVYWMMGHHQDRFKTMIAHAGVFNLESMYGSTEELFFVNWDLGGPYWKSPDVQRDYNRFSPHRFVRSWKTPLLVIHGEKDFRVPVTQGMEAFTAAQVQNVPSRFLYFPNEGHWVLKPQNGVLWHRVFFEWLGRYCR